jgi:WD40 repeat protein
LLVTAAVDGNARVYPLADDPLAEPTLVTPHLLRCPPRLADGGRLLITQPRQSTLAGVETTTGKDRFTEGAVSSLADMAVTPDGLWLWTAERDRFKRWTLRGPGSLPKWHFWSQREKQIHSIAVSANGWVAAAGADRKVELYSPASIQPFPPLAHASSVRLVAISADASTLVTVQEDGLTRAWAVPQSPPVREVGPGSGPRFARFSPTGRYVIPVGGTFRGGGLARVQLYDAKSLAPAAPEVEPGGFVADVDISPDERLLATVALPVTAGAERQKRLAATADGAVRFWDVSDGRAVGEPLSPPSEPRAIRFRPDGKQVAVACAAGEVLLIDPAGCKVLHTTPRRSGPPEFFGYHNNGMVRYAADGARLYVYGFTWGIAAIDAATGTEVYRVALGKSFDLRPSPDGAVLAVSCQDSSVRFIDAASGEATAAALEHPDWVFTARFSPDGSRLLTACRDGAARVWDWRSGSLLAVLNHGDHTSGGMVHQRDEVFGAEFTADGRLATTAGLDKTVRAWDAQTGRPAAPPIHLDQPVYGLDVAPGGDAVLAGGLLGGKVRLIDLASLARPDDRTAEDLLLLAEAVAGERLAPNGALVRLTTAEWRQRFAECRRRGLLPEPR